MAELKLLLARTFFGSNGKKALKIMLNNRNECYMHIGEKKEKDYSWDKIKLSDIELFEISTVLDGKKNQTAFYHKYNDKIKQVWINRIDNGNAVSFKTKIASKALNPGEQYVLKTLISHIIVRMSLVR